MDMYLTFYEDLYLLIAVTQLCCPPTVLTIQMLIACFFSTLQMEWQK